MTRKKYFFEHFKHASRTSQKQLEVSFENGRLEGGI